MMDREITRARIEADEAQSNTGNSARRKGSKSAQGTDSGFALAVVLLILLVLLVLGAAVLISTATNSTITGNYRVSNETFSLANAGLERVTNWFTNSYTPLPPPPGSPYIVTPVGVTLGGKPVTLIGTPQPPNNAVPVSNFPVAATVTSFTREFSDFQVISGQKDYGRYSVDARLLSINVNKLPFGGSESIERWQVEIKASEPNAAPAAQISALIEISTPSYFGYAIKADDEIDLNQSVNIDSYDSRLGAYGGANISTEPANIGSNNKIDLSQNVFIKGDADYFNTISLNQSATVTGRQTKLTSKLLFDDPTYTLPAASLGNQILSGVTTLLGPGRYGALDLASGAVVTLTSGIYYATSLKLTGTAKILVNPLTGPVKIYVDGDTEIKQNAEIISTLTGPLSPTNLFLYTKKLKMEQQAKLSAAVYAYSTAVPDGEVELKQNSQLFGAIATKKCKMEQSCDLHYDIALRDQYQKGNKFRLVYWSYKNFF